MVGGRKPRHAHTTESGGWMDQARVFAKYLEWRLTTDAHLGKTKVQGNYAWTLKSRKLQYTAAVFFAEGHHGQRS